MVRLEFAPAAKGFALKLAVAPVGKPLVLRVACPVNPLWAATPILYEPVIPPAATVWEFGVADGMKSAAAVTIKVASTVWLAVVPSSLIFRGYVPGEVEEVVTIVRSDEPVPALI